MIISLDSNSTYIGATNNFKRRLFYHNTNRGAKYTRSQNWIPVLIVSGFANKNSCLSFEKGWQKLYKRRANCRLTTINHIYDHALTYTHEPNWDRVMDLLYFTHNFTLLDTKFKLNADIKYPIYLPDMLTINIVYENWIGKLPWPYFVKIRNVHLL